MKQQDSASGAIVIRKFNKPHNAAEWLELVMNAIFFLCGILAIGCVALITVYMVISGLPAIGQIGRSFFWVRSGLPPPPSPNSASCPSSFPASTAPWAPSSSASRSAF